jgi:hypothetical protein
MSPKFGYSIFKRHLEQAGVNFAELSLAGSATLLVTEHWGKAFGPFDDESDPGTLWISDRAADLGYLNVMVEESGWCIGGDRLWLAPEVQFNIVDRDGWDQEGAYVLPGSIDPGYYRLSVGEGGCITLEQTIGAKLYNLASGKKRVNLRRRFYTSRDPLSHRATYREVSDKVRYTGYSEEVTVEDLSGGEAAVEAWNLLQVRPGGLAVLPLIGGGEYQDYYEPVDSEHLKITNGTALLKLTGKRKYKVGWKSAGVCGRIGYYRLLESGELRLIVRHFFTNPSSVYVDEPARKRSSTTSDAIGDSVQFYNDGGSLGGFGEIEVHGQSVGPHRARRSVVDYLEFWQYTGSADHIRRIGEMLLGTSACSWE